MINVNKNILKKIYLARPIDAHKYDYGNLIIIGGSEFYSGSPALSALAAFRSGVDMASVIAPKRAADIIASFCPDMAAYPLGGSHLNEDHLATLIFMTESAKIVSRGKTAVVIGGGAGRSEETQQVILKYLSQVSVPVVIDADAIHALAKNVEVIKNKNFIITPHSYEFFILTGKEIRSLPQEKRISLIKNESQRLGTTIIFKGATDIISNGQEIALNKTGSPYLTKGGTGDTLAGIAGALLARGVDCFTAAQAAAYINGKAGQIVAKEKKEGLLATELIEAIPRVLI